MIGDIMTGYIYIIRNTVNSCVYVGQTVQGIDKRYKQHVDNAKNTDSRRKLYRAMRKIGIDKFYVEPLDKIEFSGNELTELEQYYIDKFNSIETGYNAIKHDDTYSYSRLQDYEKEQIKQDYINGESLLKIAVNHDIQRQLVSKICHGVQRNKDVIIHKSNTPRPIVVYDRNFNPIAVYKQQIEAKHRIDAVRIANGKKALDERNFYSGVQSQATKGNIANGYRFQYLSDLRYAGMTFRQIFDILNYQKGAAWAIDKVACLGEVVFCGDIAPLLKVANYREYRMKDPLLVLPTGILTNRLSIVPEQARYMRKREPGKLDIYRKDPSLLAQKIRNGDSYSQLARRHGCSPNAIKKACEQFGFSIKSIKTMQDAEFDRFMAMLENENPYTMELNNYEVNSTKKELITI